MGPPKATKPLEVPARHPGIEHLIHGPAMTGGHALRDVSGSGLATPGERVQRARAAQQGLIRVSAVYSTTRSAMLTALSSWETRVTASPAPISLPETRSDRTPSCRCAGAAPCPPAETDPELEAGYGLGHHEPAEPMRNRSPT
jgi:hypothetical protein